jgi:hypothetical protein
VAGLAGYAVARTREGRRGRVSLLEDSAFRSRLIALAGAGVSRRGAAAQVGVSHARLIEWISRGRAYDRVEPYGSFAREYLAAERMIESIASKVEAMQVQVLARQMAEYIRWRDHRGPAPVKPAAPPKPGKKATPDEKAEYASARALYDRELERWQMAMDAWEKPPEHPSVADLEWLGRLKERRFPADHGASKHRSPEPEISGAEWMEQHPLTDAQLDQLLTEPPEEIEGALQRCAPALVERLLPELLTKGWRPSDEVFAAIDAVRRSPTT